MVSNAKFVSDVIGGLKLLNKDEHISRRFVLGIGRSKCITYISQKLLDRTLYRESQLFTPVECLELTSDEIVRCPIVQFRRCKSLMVSKLPLPETIWSKFGPGILRVVSLDDGTEFEFSNSFNIVGDSKREFGGKVNKYYIYNNHIYIPNSSVEAINAEILTLYVKEASDLCGCCNTDKCKTVWDYPFVCPDKIYVNVLQETIQQVLATFKSVPADENPNLDGNQKTTTTI